VIDEHRLYLSDMERVSAYRSALAQTIKPGDVVLDLGSGTGILGLLACEAGAARVYAIDGGGMAQPARAIVRANGLEGRVIVLDGMSTLVKLPERADLLVTDQIGHFGFDLGIVEFVADARRRLLKADARLIPSRIDLWIAPIESREVTAAVDFWSGRPGGFDMHSMREMAANSGYPRRLEPEDVLGFACAGSIDLSSDQRSIVLAADVVVQRAATMSGIGGWFSTALSPDVTLTNSPLEPHRIQRRGIVFPSDRPVAVAQGDRVSVRMRIIPADLMMNWTINVFRRGSAELSERFEHSTLRGMLLAPQQLNVTRPDYVPHLTERGKARLSVLELCDGRRPLAAIEREVFDRHRDLFRDRDTAAVFVAEVVSGYSE